MISQIGSYFQNIFRPQPGFDLEDMKQKAQEFANGKEELLHYITSILDDEKFQSNPRGYLDAWKEKRGNSEIKKFPEDRARTFFDQNFKF